MKILIVHNRYRSVAPSGENRVVDLESAALGALGHEVEHFERDSDEIETRSPARKAMLPAEAVWSPSSRRDLAAVLRRFKPDVAHLHNTFPLLSPSVLYACRDAGVPVVFTLHNYRMMCASGDFFRDGAVCLECVDGRTLPALKHRCFRGSALATVPAVITTRAHRSGWRNLVSAYIFVSDAQRRLLEPMALDPERVFVKPNLVPYDGKWGLPRDRQVAYVGRLDVPKGVRVLLRAWDRYRELAGDDALRLMIAGGGPLLDEVSRWAADRPSVTMTGMLDRQQCFELLARSRSVLLPSLVNDTFGLVVVEAMAAGVAPIASTRGAFPELISEGVDGRLVPPGDPDELARVLLDVDADPDRYERYGLRARTTYTENHDPARNTGALLDIYQFAMRRPVLTGN